MLEGSVPNEEINGEGHWAGFGVDPETGQPIPTTTWIDRLAPRADGVLALGTCAAYGGIPAMKNNPTGAMGLRDYLGADLDVAARPAGREPARLPGAARQHHRDAARARAAPRRRSARRSTWTSRAGPCRLFGRTAHESCDRAGLADAGQYSHDARRRPAAS